MQSTTTLLSLSNIDKIFDKDTLSFACQKHKKKTITHFCTEVNCENRILCSECLLSDHLFHLNAKKVQDITDFVEDNKFLLDPQRKIADAMKEVESVTKKTKHYVDDKLDRLKQTLIDLIAKLKRNCEAKVEAAREQELQKLRKIQERIVNNAEGTTAPRKISSVFELKAFLEALYKKRTILEENAIFGRFDKFYKDLQTSQDYIRKSFTSKLEGLVAELQQSIEGNQVVALSPAKNGILKTISIKELKQFGWQIVLEQHYEGKLNFEDIQTIRENAGQNAKVCVGAIETKNPDILVLCAVANCKKALLESTSSEKGTLVDGAYWYNFRGKSIGFSDREEVNLNKADALEGDLRLSWHYNNPGYRIGNVKNFGKEWKKIILLNDWVQSKHEVRYIAGFKELQKSK